MRDDNRQGPANGKTFLDRLAPLLFPPRVEKRIDLEQALRLAGLAPALYNLAQILESCLLNEAGNLHHNGESYTLNGEMARVAGRADRSR